MYIYIIMDNTQKTKQDRLKEGINLLTQLCTNDIKQNGNGYIMLKKSISTWVNDGNKWEGSIEFIEHGRIAHVTLPYFANKVAGIQFNVKTYW